MEKALNDRVAKVDPHHKKACPKLEVLENSAGRSSGNLSAASGIASTLAISLHQRARVDGADGNHQRRSQRHGLPDDAASGASKSQQELKVRRKLGGTLTKELLANSEEDRQQQTDIQKGKSKHRWLQAHRRRAKQSGAKVE